MSFATARVAPEKQFHRLPAVGTFCDVMEMDMDTDQIRVIERLREAAKEHGEVHDLLLTMRDCILIDDLGNKEIVASAEDLAYLKAALMAADFAIYDKGE